MSLNALMTTQKMLQMGDHSLNKDQGIIKYVTFFLDSLDYPNTHMILQYEIKLGESIDFLKSLIDC